MEKLKEIASHFEVFTSIKPHGEGHINNTYLVTANENFILQKINHSIFKSPEDVMENIFNVTTHIKNKKISQNQYNFNSVLTVIPTLSGEPFYKTPEGEYYRMYSFIGNAISHQSASSPDILYNAAKGFGEFFSLLSDFDATLLHETIPNFHNTVNRYENLINAVNKNEFNRVDEVINEIDFAKNRKEFTHIVVDYIKTGEIPLRVTHNDSKLNNIMLDEITNEPVCVIDLDTVMPGSLLYDYGDALRFGSSTAAEDEQDLNKVYCDLELFEAFTKGFIEETKSFLSPKECEILHLSPILLTLECGMRFLTDYIEGDVYFKTTYPKQNLYRAINQFKLVSDMESKKEEMKNIVQKYL